MTVQRKGMPFPVVNCLGMQSKPHATMSNTASVVDSMLLSMLDSLSDALDKKADDVEERGDPDSEVRAVTLRDVAETIRERFSL